MIDKLKWMRMRLKSMPPAEIPHRLKEQMHRRRDRQQPPDFEISDETLNAPLPAWPLPENLGESEAWKAARDGLLCDAESLLDGTFTMLGLERRADERTAWSRDPETGREWPSDQFCFDVDFRHGFEGLDVKATWELHRLQHLQLLAWVARFEGDARARSACLADLEDWMRCNPPYLGIGYASGIELASRVLSVLVVLGLLGEASVSKDLRALIWRMLIAHAHWIDRYPSLHSSANNHRIAELGALFVLGCLAPTLPDSERWREDSASELIEECRKQIHGDGIGGEQSPTYQAYTLEWFLCVRTVATATGHALAASFKDRLESSALFFCSILDRNGNHPSIGDDDEGVVLRQSLEPEHYVLSVCGVIASALENPKLRPRAHRPDLRAALLGFVECKPSRYRRKGRTFSTGGYTVLAAKDEGREAIAVFDHGPVGYAWTAGHGHADALSVWLHLDGHPVLVDTGTYRYNGLPDWREYIRSTAAHNTVQLANLEQSETAGPFNWGRRAEVKLIRSEPERTGGWVAGQHDGYVSSLGVVHKRRVSLDGLLSFEICDTISVADSAPEGMPSTVPVVVRLHFAADLQIKEGTEGWSVHREDNEVLRVLVPSVDLSGRVLTQSSAPSPGVLAYGYNRLVPGACLEFVGELSPPTEWTIRLVFAG